MQPSWPSTVWCFRQNQYSFSLMGRNYTRRRACRSPPQQVVSPRRPVPAAHRPPGVRRPPGAGSASPARRSRTPRRSSGCGSPAGWPRRRASWSARTSCPGVTTDELDRIGHEFLCDHGAYPSTLGYRGFPKSLCSSVNEVICHGIPDARVVEDGDIVNIDITAFLDGVHGDTNATFLAGDVDEESRLLVERTKESLDRAIKAVKPGRRVNVIGRVIEAYAKRFGYGVVRDFTGHGIGTAFHSGLIIPHYDDARFDDEIRVGMTFTIEPMLNLGTPDYDMWDDGWTVVTKDRRRSAQFEHTLLVTADRRRGAHPPLSSLRSREWVGRAAAVRHLASSGGSRKVRAPQGRVVANSHPGKPAGSVPQRTDRLPACRER